MWWTDSGVIAIVATYLLVGGAVIYWIYLQRDFRIAAEILAVFWTIMFPVLVLLAKRTVDHLPTYVDRKVIDRTQAELEQNRRQVRKEFLETEIAALERGEATPVLDVWRLDPSLEKRHLYFSSLDAVSLDPTSHELWIRIGLGELHWTPDEAKKNKAILLQGVADFLLVVSKDGYVRLLGKFFERLVLELYALREHEEREVPYPVFSLLVEKSMLARVALLPKFPWTEVEKAGDCRFGGGNDVEPHRSIPIPAARGK
ncbi:MAG: hypothetical protein WBD36_06215 [Bacteroidota bacterium]